MDGILILIYRQTYIHIYIFLCVGKTTTKGEREADDIAIFACLCLILKTSVVDSAEIKLNGIIDVFL